MNEPTYRPASQSDVLAIAARDRKFEGLLLLQDNHGYLRQVRLQFRRSLRPAPAGLRISESEQAEILKHLGIDVGTA